MGIVWNVLFSKAKPKPEYRIACGKTKIYLVRVWRLRERERDRENEKNQHFKFHLLDRMQFILNNFCVAFSMCEIMSVGYALKYFSKMLLKVFRFVCVYVYLFQPELAVVLTIFRRMNERAFSEFAFQT